MINYDEMSKVINDLNNYISKIQKFAEVQQKLDGSINDLSNIKENMKTVEQQIKSHSQTVGTVLSVHDNIKNNIETVLQDYKKLNSAFEIVEIELKKINLKSESATNELKEIKQSFSENQRKILEDIKNLNENVRNQLIEIKNESDKNTKKLNWILGTLIGFGCISILILILNLLV